MNYEKPVLLVAPAGVAVQAMDKEDGSLDNHQPPPQFDTTSAYQADE